MPQHQTHTLEQVFDAQSRVLVLGSFPSPLSRQTGFYYGNPHNRFWPVMAALWNEPVPSGAGERRDFALRHRVALWDVIAECVIEGADDGSIRQVRPNPLHIVLDHADIAAIFTCGSKAFSLYNRHCLPVTGRSAIPLPSTSPANCRYYDLPKLIAAYRVIRDYTD